MACINHNDITYKTLLELSGLTQLELDAKVRRQLEDTGTYPFIEQVISGDTIPALIKRYNLTKSGDYYIAQDTDLDNVPHLNKIYRDLEITVTPLFDGESRVEVKKRATINRDLEVADNYLGVYTKHNTPIFPQPIAVVNSNFIYENNGEYYVSKSKIGTYNALTKLPKTKNLKAAYAKADSRIEPLVITRDTVRFISENLNAINAGENVLYHSSTELPNTVSYYNNFNYPKFEIDNSLKEVYKNENGKLFINPKFIDNTPKALERVLLQAEGLLDDAQILESLNRLTMPLRIEILKVENNGYLLRNSSKDNDINEYHPPVQSGSIRLNRLEAMLDRLSDLYGIEFHRVNSEDLKFGNFKKYVPDASRVNAFILDGEIYINTDNASDDAPIHELSHMLLGTLKSTDYNLYSTLVSSVENLEDYQDRLEEFPYRSRMDANEEIFVDTFAKHFTNNLELSIDPNILNRAEYEIKRNIDSAIFPNESVTKVSLENISGKSFSEIMDTFGTSINEESIANAFNGNEAGTNRKLANIKEDLLKQGLLKEYCE